MLADMAGGQIPAFGDVHVVVASTDTADPNYQKLQELFAPANGFVRFWTNLNDAYTACTTNNNDLILLDAHTSHTITPFVWSKSRIHVIGMDGGDRLRDQGSKVQNSATDTAAYVLQVTGIRNSFRNVKFIQNSTQATGLHVVEDGSAQTLWKNCSFTFGVATNLGLTTAHEFLAGSDTCTFLDCAFGSDTVLTSAARSVFHIIEVTAAQEFKSNTLKDCLWIMSSSSSTATFVRLDAVDQILFTNTFINPTFIASVDSAGGAAIAMASQTGTGTVKGCLLYVQPAAFNCTAFTTSGSGNNAATQVVRSVSSATAGVGIQPTA